MLSREKLVCGRKLFYKNDSTPVLTAHPLVHENKHKLELMAQESAENCRFWSSVHSCSWQLICLWIGNWELRRNSQGSSWAAAQSVADEAMGFLENRGDAHKKKKDLMLRVYLSVLWFLPSLHSLYFQIGFQRGCCRKPSASFCSSNHGVQSFVQISPLAEGDRSSSQTRWILLSPTWDLLFITLLSFSFLMAPPAVQWFRLGLGTHLYGLDILILMAFFYCAFTSIKSVSLLFYAVG